MGLVFQIVDLSGTKLEGNKGGAVSFWSVLVGVGKKVTNVKQQCQ
jgi:hypothetical protein